jgi:FtsZ-binding cell division protein ZapB
MTKLSISEAARRAGVERPALYRRMKKGELSRETGPDGKPVIDLSELCRLYPHAVTPHAVSEAVPAIQHDTPHISLLQAKIEALQEQIRLMERERDTLADDRADLRTERDKLLDVVASQTRQLTGPQQAERPLWRRLLARS